MHRFRMNQCTVIILMFGRGLTGGAVTLCAVLLMTGCNSKSGPHGGHLKLSDAEVRYGVAPTRNDKVVYQDDVVIVGHGAEDVRSVSSDGLTWTINEHAAHVEDLQPGRIMFITARGVGRVLGVQRNNDGLGVTLGPVALTDVIKETEISFDQPVDMSQMIAYSAPDFPGSSVEAFRVSEPGDHPDGPTSYATDPVWRDVSPVRENTLPGLTARYLTDYALAGPTLTEARLSTGYFSDVANVAAFAPPLPLPQFGAPGPVDISGFKVVPFCCGGLGIKIEHDSDGVRIMAYAVLRLQNPSLHFNLAIHGGKVTTAELQLKGIAGLTMQFEAASTTGVNGNINQQISVPLDLSIPIFGLPVPLAITMHQAFIFKTAFSARNTTLRATGDYAMDGELFMGYHNGSWGAGAPTKFVVRQSLLDSINGISLGANGLVMAYSGKVIVGIGAFGFVTGPYFGYNVGIGAVRGSDAAGFPLGMPVCRAASLDIGIAVGIGYSIPQPVTKAINFILRNLNLRTIEGTGGLEHRESLIQQHAAVPDKCG